MPRARREYPAPRVVEYHGLRRLLEVDDPGHRRAVGSRYVVQGQAGPLGAWTLVLATNDPERAYAALHAGMVGRVG